MGSFFLKKKKRFGEKEKSREGGGWLGTVGHTFALDPGRTERPFLTASNIEIPEMTLERDKFKKPKTC